MSKKKARQKPETEVVPKETSRPRARLQSIASSGEETDEDDKISPNAVLCPRGLRTKGPMVIIMEEMLHAEKETERVTVDSATILEWEIM